MNQRASNDSPKRIQRPLLTWFRKAARDLPWRQTRDPYAVWLSEVILQQTRVDQGMPYYERFIQAFPTVHSLAAAPESAVLKLWEGLGYYSRARNLHRAAKQIVEEHGGALPQTANELAKLPGVGPYTAGAIASIAFGERVPVVDGNVKRVLARLYAIDESIDSGPVSTRLWALAGTLVSKRYPGDFNQALMELGARVCTPKQPDCPRCPLRRQCGAYAAGIASELPVRRARKTVPHKELAVAAIRRNDGRYLIVRRPSNGMLGGLWEFPNGPLGPGEDHARALERIAANLVGVSVKPGKVVASVGHVYSHLKVTMTVYLCEAAEGEVALREHTAAQWALPSAFAQYAFPKAHHKFLHRLQGQTSLGRET
ncbi:MAG: A/G-specific adenine glycosylase [Candidatus Hydrogenedentota bacterium]